MGCVTAWFRGQQTSHIVATNGGQSAIERDHTPAMSARQPKKISIGDLLRSDRVPHFGHCYGWMAQAGTRSRGSEQ